MRGVRPGSPSSKQRPVVVWPPPPPTDETPEQRQDRLDEEVRAKERSDEIDKEIHAQKELKKKKKPGMGAKILLLGQAESGKSTVLKNFQLQFAPKAFESEADIWRPVIHLNLVRSVNFIVNFLNMRLAGLREVMGDTPVPQQGGAFQLSTESLNLLIRLAPLRQIEETLSKAISGVTSAPSNDSSFTSRQKQYNSAKAPEDVSIPSGYGWKKAILGRHSQDSTAASQTDVADLAQARRVLTACGEDIASLWNDHSVQHALKTADISLEDQPGFFLDEALRVTAEDYRPISDDVLKARVTTVGPEEHVIRDEKDPDSKEWTIYDVGGSRSQRAAWAQFFDDVNIIIFLAPISAFNQVLAEDESINRLTDSLRLWQTICSNKILANLEFVLFLNKLDILQSKLKAGIKFSEFVSSYVDKPNEIKPVAKYLLDVFVSLHQKHSPKRRKLHPHLTCAVDTKATSSVIARIRDLILVSYLSQTNVL